MEAARCTRLCYFPENAARVQAAKMGFAYQRHDQGKNSLWIGRRDDDLVIAIRGSVFERKTAKNYLTNLDTELAPWMGAGLVHSGYLSIFWSFLKFMKDAVADAHRVVFTGHSMGGAIALLAAQYFSADSATVFATTRVGNLAFKESFNPGIAVKRFETRCDLLARYPVLGTVRGGALFQKQSYHHVGRAIRLPAFGHSMRAYMNGLKLKGYS